LGVHAHRIIGTDGQRLADGGFGVRPAHGDAGDRSALRFFQFQGAHQGIPFIVGVHDEGDAVPVVLGVVVREGDAGRGIGHLADQNEDLHRKASCALGPRKYTGLTETNDRAYVVH
jgi:hypothetical protein